MAFLEYVLVAVLGSTGAAATSAASGGASTPSYNADSVTQPIGGVGGGLSQKKPDKEHEHADRAASHRSHSRRYHKGRHHRGRRADSGQKAQ